MSNPSLSDSLEHEMKTGKARLLNDFDNLIKRLQDAREQVAVGPGIPSSITFYAETYSRDLTKVLNDAVKLATQSDIALFLKQQD